MINKVIVASLGRCGSSMLYWTILQGIQDQMLAIEIEKTHKFFDNKLDYSKNKIIFLYTNPVDIVLSLFNIQRRNVYVEDCNLTGSKFIEAHVSNMLGIDFNNNVEEFSAHKTVERLVMEDTLNLEAMFKSYIVGASSMPDNVLNIHYDTIWDREKEISEFLGFDITLPVREERINSNLEVIDEIKMQLEVTYYNLIKLVENERVRSYKIN